MRRVIIVIASVALAFYPAMVYFGIARFGARMIASVLMGLAGLRLITLIGMDRSRWAQFLPLMIAVSIAAIASFVLDSKGWLLMTPVLLNTALMVSFSMTLVNGPSMIARFAMLGSVKPTPGFISYTRKVTVVWCVFFFFNAIMAGLTVLSGSDEYWALYNGLISYILIGMLVGGEMIVRKWVRRNETDETPGA